MGKRRPNDAGLEDQDPYAARMNAGAVAKPSAFGTSSFGTSSFGTAPPPTFGFGDTGGPSRPALFLHHLRALNDQFAGWVQRRVAENPLEPMTCGVSDYLAHVKQVEESFQDAMRAALDKPSGGGSPAGTAPGLSTSMASRLQPGAAAPASAFAAKPAALSFTLPPSLHASTPAAPAAVAMPAPLFPNLAAVPASAPTGAPSPFTFGGGGLSAPVTFGAGPAAPSATAFAAAPQALSFNLPSSINPFASGAGLSVAVMPGMAAAGADEVEPPPSPTKVERSGDEEILHEGKAKMFVKTGAEWKDMGLGVLTLRKGKAEGAKARVVLTSNGGRHMLNASLFEGFKCQVSPGEKGGRQLVMMLYNAEVGDGDGKGKTAQMHMLRFGKVETATAFRLVVEANVPAK